MIANVDNMPEVEILPLIWLLPYFNFQAPALYCFSEPEE